MTVLEVIQRSTQFLAQRGVESPRLQIELLLAQVLGLPRLQLYLNFERLLSDRELAQLRELVRRRGNREPLQHLLGNTSFCGFEITVNPHVLIPRPETELLAERAWTFLLGLAQARADLAAEPRAAGSSRPSSAEEDPANHTVPDRLLAVLDFGTGSGCLAVVLASKCPGARITALDLSPAALGVARLNAAHHGVADRIEFVCGDGLAPLEPGRVFDLIVANPPYIPTDEIEQLQAEVRDHDPRVALDGGPDGLAVIRRLAAEAGRFLAAGGRLMLEFGDGQADAVDGLFRAHGWVPLRIEPDDTGRLRLLVAERR